MVHSALRLFRNRPEYRFSGRLHEQIAFHLPAYLPERTHPVAGPRQPLRLPGRRPRGQGQVAAQPRPAAGPAEARRRRTLAERVLPLQPRLRVLRGRRVDKAVDGVRDGYPQGRGRRHVRARVRPFAVSCDRQGLRAAGRNEEAIEALPTWPGSLPRIHRPRLSSREWRRIALDRPAEAAELPGARHRAGRRTQQVHRNRRCRDVHAADRSRHDAPEPPPPGAGTGAAALVRRTPRRVRRNDPSVRDGAASVGRGARGGGGAGREGWAEADGRRTLHAGNGAVRAGACRPWPSRSSAR